MSFFNKSFIMESLYRWMFNILIKHRRKDLMRAIKGMTPSLEREKKSKDILKYYMKNAGKLKPLTAEQLSEVKQTWESIWDFGVVKPEWVQFYSDKTGVFNPAYVGQDLHYYYTEYDKIDFDYLRGFVDKNYIDVVLPCVKHPKMLVRKIHGLFFDTDFNPISEEEAVNIVWENKYIGAVIKVSRVSSGGKGLTFISKDNSYEEIRQALRSNSDLAVQLMLKQHPDMAKMNESSVNTIRILSIMINGESIPLSTCVRVGEDGSRVDNFSSGGVACGVNSDGTLKAWGYNSWGDKFEVHSNGFIFKDGIIPNYDRVHEAAKRCHNRVPIFGVVSWDFAIDQEGVPVLIEYNVGSGGIRIHQYCNGDLYKQYREDLIEQVFKNYSYRGATIDYNYSLKRDGAYITKGSTDMATLVIPDRVQNIYVKSIKKNAFRGNKKLKFLTIYAHLKEIEYCAFYCNIKLESVKILGAVEIIGRSAFNGCSNLTSFSIPFGTKKICTMAFRNCKKLEKIVIPETVSEIGDDVFLESAKVVVFCKNGSIAHTYAKEKGIKFKLI